MNPTEWTDASISRLKAAGYKAVDVDQSVLPGARAVRRSNFRVRWFLTRLHTFVVFFAIGQPSEADVSAVADLAARWAKIVKGGLPIGFQTGVAVIPVIVSSSADEAALQAALAKPRKRFSTMVFPMIADPVRLSIAAYNRTVAWGIAYMDFLADQQRIVVGAPDAPVLGTQGGRGLVVAYKSLLPFLGLMVIAGIAAFLLV